MAKDKTELEKKASLVFLKYYRFVSMVAFETVPVWHLQEDIVQDVYIEFVTKCERWDFNVDLKPLLRTMTKNIAVNVWRDYSRNMPKNLRDIAELLARTGKDGVGMEEDSDTDRELVVMEECLKKLTPNNLSLIEAFYKSGISMVRIADDLGEQVNTVHKRLSRVRIAVRECIERQIRYKKDEDYHV